MGAVRDLADRFTEELFTLDPDTATFVGAVGHDDRLTDCSPDGYEERAELCRRTGVARQVLSARLSTLLSESRAPFVLTLGPVEELLTEVLAQLPEAARPRVLSLEGMETESSARLPSRATFNAD